MAGYIKLNKTIFLILLIIMVLTIVVLVEMFQQESNDIETPEEVSQEQQDKLSSVKYKLIYYTKEGELKSEYEITDHDEEEKLNIAIMEYMLKSAAWESIPTEAMGEHYLIIQNNPESGEERYYIFKQEGKACMQWEKAGRWSYIMDENYKSVETISRVHEK